MKLTISDESTDLFVGVVIDKSGSMSALAGDVRGGFNEFRKEQLAQPGQTYMSVCMFSDTTVILANGADANNIPELTAANYSPGGNTALYDAIAQTINEMDKWLATHPSFKGKVQLVIQTDGYENASHEFSRYNGGQAKIKALLEAKQNAGWAVVYMGSDLDAVEEGASVGVYAGSTLSYAGGQTVGAFKNLSTSTTSYRNGKVSSQNLFNEKQNTSD